MTESIHRYGCSCCSPYAHDILHKSLGLGRRDFLKALGAGTVALGITSVVPGSLIAQEKPTVAEKIYYGGDIVTMVKDGEQVEALAVASGVILAAGKKADVLKLKDQNTEIIDLKGKSLFPGFIDPHSHLAFQSLKNVVINLDPKPIGNVGNIKELQAAYAEKIKDTKKGDWLIGFGYDDTALEEQRHPNRRDLDEISTEHPIFAFHISMHMCAVNSKALELAGITAETEVPPGGIVEREKDGKTPNGVLKEKALGLIIGKLPTPAPDKAKKILRAGAKAYAKFGITTAHEGLALPSFNNLYASLEEEGDLIIDVLSLQAWTSSDINTIKSIAKHSEKRGGYRWEAIKMSIDGSIQGYTGYLSEPYFKRPEGAVPTGDVCSADKEGTTLLGLENARKNDAPEALQPNADGVIPNVNPAEMERWLRDCDEHNVRLHVHCNGDAAADMLLSAIEKVRGDKPRPDLRTVIVHSQMIREDQLDIVKKHGMICSFFPVHISYYGDRHRDLFIGPERAARLNPCNSALKRGITFTLHHDAPVLQYSMLPLVHTAVNRITSSGKLLGGDQRIPVFEAMRAITADAAFQGYEEDIKGTLETGKWADLVVLDRNPLKVDQSEIQDVVILETIKQGKTIYNAA